MVDLIVLAGAPGSGKTTIGGRLHERLRSVYIDFGTLREFHLEQDWSDESHGEEAMAFENLVFILRNYIHHGYENVIVTDLTDRRVCQMPALFEDVDLLIATLVVHDDGELARRVRLPERDSGFRDVEAAVAWNRKLIERPAVPGERRIDNTRTDPEPAVLEILDLARVTHRG
ncbi:MAG: AAA family ATPase [Planctomycetota bacterium]|jgi:adenylate kinase family enzyme